MTAEEEARKAKIARIKRYKQIRKIRNYRRKAQLNTVAAKMLAYASIPAFACAPAAASGGSFVDGVVAAVTADISEVNDSRHMFSTIISHFDINTAVKEVINDANAEFVDGLNKQYNEIKSKGRPYARKLFGNINYCNIAVVHVLKQTSPDYMEDFLNNLENPALCSNFVENVKKSHPDCIRYERALRPELLQKGDIVVMQVKRNNADGAKTSSGNHTVTYEGGNFISFNSESKYSVKGQGYVINMNKIREKELARKLAAMDRTQAVSYLIGLSARRILEGEKTKVVTADKFASLQAYNYIRSGGR